MNNTLSYLSLFTMAVVGCLGVKTGNLVWEKIVEPKVNKIFNKTK